MKAILTNARNSPRKMRLVANLIKGKPVARALDILSFAPKRAATSLEKLLKSAISNAKNLGISTENLMVKDCRVDSGMTFKRMMPGARGASFPIRKHTSNINLVLGTKEVKDNSKGKKVAKKNDQNSDSVVKN